jgi:DNA helicase-2/ATP-dependent DNA helicase PcrA
MHRHIVIGPPGTGKTTFLKSKVNELVKNNICLPSEIGYFSFTVKAAEEIRDRVAKGSDMSKDELKKEYPYFCTLHSLAYKRLQLQQSQIMDEHDYNELSRLTGHEYVNKMKKGNGVDISMPTAKSEYQDIINLAYAKYPDDEDRLQKVFRYTTLNNYGARNMIEQMDLDLRKFKEDRSKYEYVDYFTQFLKRKNPPKLKYLFIDEAQDLSVHQWRVVDMIQEIAQPIETYVAGDDDQAIFRWAGADIEHFIAMAKDDSNTIIPLTQSYRIPISVHTLATKLAQSISTRIDKEYKPRDEEGVRKVLNIRPLNKGIKEGEWLILCRTHEIVKQVSEALEMYGWLYKRYGQSVINFKYIEAIRSWTKLQNGKSISGDYCHTLYEYMDSTRIKRNYGTFKGNAEEMYNLDMLINNFGLRDTIKLSPIKEVSVKEIAWYDMINAKGFKNRINYLRSIMRSGNKLDDKPRIEVSTIHASKGGERQKVMLITDLSFGPYQASTENQQGRDDEARVFYVGATRAKKELHIVRRTEGQFEYEPIFFHERSCRDM